MDETVMVPNLLREPFFLPHETSVNPETTCVETCDDDADRGLPAYTGTRPTYTYQTLKTVRNEIECGAELRGEESQRPADPTELESLLRFQIWNGFVQLYSIENPLKILKRKGLFHENTDKAKSVRKHPKIHWTQLAPNKLSSDLANNGKQVDDQDKNVLVKLDIKRREVKVTLTDVLQTEDGRRYLSSCKSETNAKTQTPHKRETRWRERGFSTEHSTVRRGSNTPCKNITRFSPYKLSFPSYEKDFQLSKKVQLPAANKYNKLTNSLRQPRHAAPDGEEFCSLKKRNFSASKKCHNLLPEHTESPHAAAEMLFPVKKKESLGHTMVSPINYKQISKSVITATHTRSKTKQPGDLQVTDYQDAESEAVLTRQNTSKGGAQKFSKVMNEKEGDIKQNGKVVNEDSGVRGSVLHLSTGVAKGQLSDKEVIPKSSQMTGSADKQILGSKLMEVNYGSKLQTTEPIVLSSEEEEDREDSETQHVQAVEGNKALHVKSVQARERKKLPDAQIYYSDFNSQDSKIEASTLSVCPVMELQFSSLYIGSFSVFSNGLVKITDNRITISFKDSSGSEVKAFLATAHVRKYSVLDGLSLRDSRLAKENFLVLWLAEVQAQRLSSELSVFQPGIRPAEGSTCFVLCVLEPLNGVQGALLASIMDIVGLRHGNTELLSPLTHSDSLNILQNSRDCHMLQLLLSRAETHTHLHESAPAIKTKTSAKDSDVQPESRVYTVCQSRGQSAYSVSLAHKPKTDWTQYRHYGPARRLIQFPPPPSKGAITLTTEDLECLDSGEFLNDVIIDFYLKYLLVQKAPQASVNRAHIFSSFFYKQLTRRDNANEDSTSTPAQLRRHQRVRTWTRHVDIFKKDFLFVPVNQESHWYLVVVCFPGLEEPQYVERGGHACMHDVTENSSNDMTRSESQHDEISARSISAYGPPKTTDVCRSNEEQMMICPHQKFCSLYVEGFGAHAILQTCRYLQAEWKVKRGCHRDFSAELIVGSHCRVPLQDNSSDCGLYLLQYAESFLQDPLVHFELPLNLECWFPQQKVREKREEIRNLVLHLYRFQQGSLENDSSDEFGNTVQ
ncbi:Sentrin-specific protease 7 [Bagarius yarrelli]|uniref:Sentrin-specific protease 7 n=1 Tax=Bagarius yarrelli TaxID=175774 RepID=A0A556VD50_BAGYA|nr:Sentrin-specific protease 7 [Bagarius yarrelli]